MPYNLIIFDCDGTLVDSEHLNNLSTVQLLHEEGLTQFDVTYATTHFTGLKFSATLENISAETGHIFPDTMRDRYIARVRELAPTYLGPIDGAIELVEYAQTIAKTCVASNGQRDNVLYSLEQTGLKPLFPDDKIFTAIQVDNPKPAPDLFLMPTEEMGVAPVKTLVIEDSVTGITGALAAGMTVWGFSSAQEDPDSAAETLKNAGAARVYTSLIHIHEAIEKEKALL